MANVRNDFGRVKPIAYPRGLPECISATVARDADIWKLDGHSYSYYTLTEIINFDWNNRLFYYTMDMNKAHKNIIEDSDRIWNFNGFKRNN